MIEYPAQQAMPWLYRPVQRKGISGYAIYIPPGAQNIETRIRKSIGPGLRFEHVGGSIWRVANIRTMKDMGRRLAQTYGTCELWFEHVTAELCTEMCQDADPQFSDLCQCPCIGTEHGKNSPGWTPVADYLLVRVKPGLTKMVIPKQ